MHNVKCLHGRNFTGILIDLEVSQSNALEKILLDSRLENEPQMSCFQNMYRK